MFYNIAHNNKQIGHDTSKIVQILEFLSSTRRLHNEICVFVR